jgi:hypothetical protein
MHPPLLRSSLMSAAVLATAMVNPAPSQMSRDLKTRCDQLVAFFDRYGASRTENSDGARNYTRIGAAIDCQRGDYVHGIAAMEALLKRKRFEVPPPPTASAQGHITNAERKKGLAAPFATPRTTARAIPPCQGPAVVSEAIPSAARILLSEGAE